MESREQRPGRPGEAGRTREAEAVAVRESGPVPAAGECGPSGYFKLSTAGSRVRSQGAGGWNGSVNEECC